MASNDPDETETTEFTEDEPTNESYQGESESPTGAETESEAVTEESKKKKKKRKKRFQLNDCPKEKWTCDDKPIWQVYMKSYAENAEKDKETDPFDRRKPVKLPRLPMAKSEKICIPQKCFPLNIFQLGAQAELPDNTKKEKMTRIWKRLRETYGSSPPCVGEPLKKTESGRWPASWPCTTRNLVAEHRHREKQSKLRKHSKFPCEPDTESEVDEEKEEFSKRKELGHARIPPACPKRLLFLVDQAAGEHPGLVDGDYVRFQLSSAKKGNRVYANVCLRGLKGMHLPELGPLRCRKMTWKFCFYQAVVALLAKTQLRYKYAWTTNIDYIFDHAWMLYIHIGMINVKDKQRLDDVVVYNYKYSVEVEIAQEMKDVEIPEDAGFDYQEKNLKVTETMERPELMDVKLELGSEKKTDAQTQPIHPSTKKIEKFIEMLDSRFRNCIFRTSRFSLAFWQDGLFWYLYNPYRCDEYGFWDDLGYACIIKFCSLHSLKRHLIVLLLRAYSYQPPSPKPENEADSSVSKDQMKEEEKKYITDIQIFHMIYHCCKIDNLKLLERGAPRPRTHWVKKKHIDDCPFDPLDMRNPCAIEQENEEDLTDSMEKPTWLKLYKLTWARCQVGVKKKSPRESTVIRKLRWHQFLIEEPNKLFSLWGDLHITNVMFERENRGMQTYACYVVCSGMTRIMAPEYWSSKILDVIVMCGDRYYTKSKYEAELKATKPEYESIGCWSRYLASTFTIGEIEFEANVLPAICGRLYARTPKYLRQCLEQLFLKYHFCILTCESSCLGLFKFCGAYYMCDVNSCGPPLFQYGCGSAYLMRATYFHKFMIVLILTIGSPECSQFSLNPVEILKVVDVGPVDRVVPPTEKCKRKPPKKTVCPFDDEKRKEMKKWKTRRPENRRTIDRAVCKVVD